MKNKETQKKTVYVIGGPTSVGKSIVAYYLALRIGGEIINCDSVQLYKYMDIGSAKPTKEQMEKVPHHLYSIVEPSFDMTVAKYRKLALAVIDDVLSRGKVPIVVGGTGLYLNSILYDMSFASAPKNDERRRELEEMAEKNGTRYMFEYLTGVDPEAAARLHPNNLRKIIRAIEVWEAGDQIKSLDCCPPNPKYDFKFFGLIMERDWLYNRINARVLKLFKEGLVQEVKSLMDMGYDENSHSMKGIGYKEVISYLKGETDIKECIRQVMVNTRHYAKRQITWLKRYDNINWIEIRKGDSVGDIIDILLEE